MLPASGGALAPRVRAGSLWRTETAQLRTYLSRESQWALANSPVTVVFGGPLGVGGNALKPRKYFFVPTIAYRCSKPEEAKISSAGSTFSPAWQIVFLSLECGLGRL